MHGIAGAPCWQQLKLARLLRKAARKAVWQLLQNPKKHILSDAVSTSKNLPLATLGMCVQNLCAQPFCTAYESRGRDNDSGATVRQGFVRTGDTEVKRAGVKALGARRL